jgi:hypothetical protein
VRHKADIHESFTTVGGRRSAQQFGIAKNSFPVSRAIVLQNTAKTLKMFAQFSEKCANVWTPKRWCFVPRARKRRKGNRERRKLPESTACDFNNGNGFPHVFDQCRCENTIAYVPEDVAAVRNELIASMFPLFYDDDQAYTAEPILHLVIPPIWRWCGWPVATIEPVGSFNNDMRLRSPNILL